MEPIIAYTGGLNTTYGHLSDRMTTVWAVGVIDRRRPVLQRARAPTALDGAWPRYQATPPSTARLAPSPRRRSRTQTGIGLRMDFSITYEHLSDRMTTVRTTGELDVYNSPKARSVIRDLVAHGHILLVFDLDEVDFVDSTGFGVLIGALKRARAHEGMVVIATQEERILKQFRIQGLTKVFPIFSNAHEAEAWVARESHIGS